MFSDLFVLIGVFLIAWQIWLLREQAATLEGLERRLGALRNDLEEMRRELVGLWARKVGMGNGEPAETIAGEATASTEAGVEVKAIRESFPVETYEPSDSELWVGAYKRFRTLTGLSD